MIEYHTRAGHFVIRQADESDASSRAEIQQVCFPTLAADELLQEVHFANHSRIFPEGQLVVIDKSADKIVASSSTLRMDFPTVDHSFMEATDQLWITGSHQPEGEWLYQFDIGVLPEYRGLGHSKVIYQLQQQLVRDLGMKGQITVGMTIGYEKYKDSLSIEEYCEKLRKEELTDPTVTPQRKAGFQWVSPVYNYVDDPRAGNCSIFMAWPLQGVRLEDYLPNMKK
ncbi:MAG: hypothetical protein ACLFQO_07510 [Cyclobacteriaceae bacterium]